MNPILSKIPEVLCVELYEHLAALIKSGVITLDDVDNLFDNVAFELYLDFNDDEVDEW